MITDLFFLARQRYLRRRFKKTGELFLVWMREESEWPEVARYRSSGHIQFSDGAMPMHDGYKVKAI